MINAGWATFFSALTTMSFAKVCPIDFGTCWTSSNSAEGGKAGAALSHEESRHNEAAHRRADGQNSDSDHLMEAKPLHPPGTKGSN